MSLELDESLISHGVLEIKRVGNDIVILASKDKQQLKFTLKIKQNREEFINILEKKCCKALGEILCQDMIEFISRDENWSILCPSEAELKQKIEQQVLVEKYKPKHHFDNFERWQVAVENAYHNLHKIIDDNIPQAWPAIEFVLSVKAILHIKEITLPYIGIILGPPAGVKTVPLELLNGRPYTFFTDKFNPRAMVSHVILPKGMEEGEQHMLNKMKNTIVLASELASLFSGREEEVREIISLLARAADGQGLETDSGLGHKGVTGKVMFVMTGAGVEFSPMVYGMLSTVGPKLYCFRLPRTTRTHEQYFQDLKGDQFIAKHPRMKEAMTEYLDIFESCPIAEAEEGLKYYLPKISLEKFRISNSDDVLHIIVNLGYLLKHLRLVTWTREYNISTKKTTQQGGKTETFETEERDYSFNTSTMEDQGRANQQLYNLALGHALSMGRTSLGIEDIPLIVKVTLSTAPQNRHRVFDELLDLDGEITTSQIQDNLGLHWNTANKTMTEFVAIGLVDLVKTGEEHNNTIKLKDDFSYFTDIEFEAVRRDNYRRYHEYLENLKVNEEKPSPSQDEGKSVE